MFFDLIKKSLLIFAAIFILVTLLYLAFYLFIVVIVILGGLAIYAKFKGFPKDHTIFKYKHYSSAKSTSNASAREGKNTEKIIDVEYEEISPKDDR